MFDVPATVVFPSMSVTFVLFNRKTSQLAWFRRLRFYDLCGTVDFCVCLGSLIPVRQLVPSVGGADWNFGVSSSLYAT